jgi:cold shock CspA family protein
MSQPAHKSVRSSGTVKAWFESRGFGFLTTDDHREFFAHISQVVDGEPLCKGRRVTFIADKGRDGRPFARQILVDDR